MAQHPGHRRVAAEVGNRDQVAVYARSCSGCVHRSALRLAHPPSPCGELQHDSEKHVASQGIGSSQPQQNLHSCFLIDIILNFIIINIITI